MKKITLALTVGVFCLGLFSSCKKDYTCTCDFSTTTDWPIHIYDAKKADAENICTDAETTYQLVDAGANCTLTAD